MAIIVDIELDVLGTKSPILMVIAKKELAKLASGDVLTLRANDAGALMDIPMLLKKTGDTILESTHDGSIFTIKIEKL
ncbi:MAG TPA: sulfurtransferase TusA family protein [Candidatus Lokiarchaeia archaeon]|nr:sulfurtransferase TusA family protein [Candidatus Lokiarchaeia archaeon]